MATEIFTNYPIPPDGWRPLEPLQRLEIHAIERRLGAIEESLSRIEQMLSEGRNGDKE